MKLVSKLLNAILDVVKGIINGLLNNAKDLISSISNIFDIGVDMPLIKTLFNTSMLLDKGIVTKDFTILNAFSNSRSPPLL